MELIYCKFNDLKNNPEKWPLDTSMISEKTTKHTNIMFLKVDDAIKETVRRYFKH